MAADAAKGKLARLIIEQVAQTCEIICPFQVFGECYQVLRRSGRQHEDCRSILESWRRRFAVAGSDEAAFLVAIDLATDHNLQFWDSLILAVSAQANCQLLLSEDMQDGFTWRGVTIVNPFVATIDARLARLLTE
jgi:predicted nucleic acid-binding protein